MIYASTFRTKALGLLLAVFLLPVQQAFGQGGFATLSCEPSATTAQPGDSVTVDVFLTGGADIRGYQIAIASTRTSGTGDLTLACPNGAFVNEARPDWLFFGLRTQNLQPTCTNCGIVEPDCARQRIVVARVAGGVNPGPSPMYLASFTLTVSPDATPGSTFEVEVLPFTEQPVPNRSIVGDTGNDSVPTIVGDHCLVTVPPVGERGACCNTEADPFAPHGECIDNLSQAECLALPACADPDRPKGCRWFQNDTCSAVIGRGDCPANPIPAVSEWGLVVLALVLLIGAKLYFGRRPSPTQGTPGGSAARLSLIVVVMPAVLVWTEQASAELELRARANSAIQQLGGCPGSDLCAPEGTPISVVVTCEWVPPQELPICVWAENLPLGAVFPTVEGTGSVSSTMTWTPTLCQSGPYQAVFGCGEACFSAGTTVESDIFVENVNRQPSISASPPGPLTVALGGSVQIDVTAIDSDTAECAGTPNADDLTVSQTGGPGSFHDSGGGIGKFEWTPGEVGDYTVSFVVDDGQGGGDTTSVQITVGPPPPVCGNGIVEEGEECDPPAASSAQCEGGECRSDCTCAPPPPVCGNGIVEPGEECDPPAASSAQCEDGECRSDCTCAPSVCGNGIVEPGEECDPPGVPCDAGGGPGCGVCNDICKCQDACDDGNVCTVGQCIDGSCTIVQTFYGDVANSVGCGPDNAVDENDIAAVAAGFTEDLDPGCSLSNADIFSSSGCMPDRVVDLFDMFGVLSAFAGNAACPCPPSKTTPVLGIDEQIPPCPGDSLLTWPRSSTFCNVQGMDSSVPANAPVSETGLGGPCDQKVCPPRDTESSLPVHLVNGEAKLRVVDLHVPGRGLPFVWTRTYSSRADFDASLGHNWQYAYERRVVRLPDGDASLINGLGREDVHQAKADGTFLSPAGIFDSLVQNPDNTYTQVHATGMRFDYDADGYLTAMADRAGNTLTIERNDFHNIVRIVDTQDRMYTLAYTDGTPPDYNDGTPGQRIASLTDFAGRQIVYTYDANGDLIRVRSPVVTGTPNGNDFPDGKTTLYTYTSGFADERLNHNLVSVVEPLYNVNNDPAASKPWVTLSYAATTDENAVEFDQVISQRWGHDQGGPLGNPNINVGGTTIFSYTGDLTADPDAPAETVLRTAVTDRNGNVRHYYFDIMRRVRKSIVRTNRNVRPAEGDYISTYEYNPEGLLASVTVPRGNGTSFLYDSDNPRRESRSNLLEVRRTSNGIGGGVDLATRYTYEPVFNQLRTATDSRAFPSGTVPLDAAGHLDLADPLVARYTATNVFDYQEGTGFQDRLGIPPSEHIPEGLGDVNGAPDFNEGNVVKVQFPVIQTTGPNFGDSIIGLRTSNASGQPLTMTDPEGHVTALEYYPSNGAPNDPSDLESYLKSSTRDFGNPPHLNLTTEFDYDVAGNIIGVTDPKGQRTVLSVNALNQVVRIESRPPDPDTPETRYRTDIFYNANDDLIRFERVNLDESGAAYPHSTLVNTYEYNILHYPIARDRDKTRNDGSGPGTVRTEFYYDGNLSLTAVKLPEAVNGNQLNNIITTRFDERDLPYKAIIGDNDTDPDNASPATAVVRTFNYDPNRNILEIIDALRDAQNPDAPVTQFPSSGAGDLTALAYDGFDRRISITDAQGNLYETVYDLASDPIRRTLRGPKDHTSFEQVLLTQTDIVFDELNRVVSTDRLHFDTATGADIGDGHSVTEFSYDLDSKVVRITDDRGVRTTIEWDTADRRFKVVDHLGNETEHGYDDNSNLTALTRRDVSTDLGTPADTYVTTMLYDGIDRIIKSVDPVGSVNELFYDSRSNIVRTSDAVRGAGHPGGPGNIITYEYDALDRLGKTIRSLTDTGRGDGALIGTITTMQAWDDDSRVTARTDDNGHTTTYEYDNLNRLTEITYADSTFKRTEYDIDNRVSGWTDQNSTICTMHYDGVNRLRSRNVTPGSSVIGTTLETFAYDGASRVTRTENDDGIFPGTMSSQFQYDSLHNRTEDSQMGLAVNSVYDGAGNRVETGYPGEIGGAGRRVLTSVFDDLNRLRSIIDIAAPIATFHYKGPRRLERRAYGNDLNPISELDVVYDPLPRIIEMNHATGTGAVVPGTTVAGFHYGFDRMHHRLFEKRIHDGNVADVYRYDSIYRVNDNLQDVDLTGVPSGTEILYENFVSPDSLAYVYDGVGNRTTTTETAGGVPTATTYTQVGGVDPFDFEVNQYTTVQENANLAQNLTYDDNGNLTSDGEKTYAYDFKNRLVEVRNAATTVLLAQYAYDAFDRRSMKILPGGTTRYLYDGIECLEERDQSDMITRQYVWGNRLDNLLQEKTPTATYYAHENSIGSIAALADDSGNVVERYQYDPFGRTTVTLDGATANDYRFHAARFDPESGLYYMRARQYSPDLGRFLQRDPIGIWNDPTNLGNSYTFTASNPLNLIDPLGDTIRYLADFSDLFVNERDPFAAQREIDEFRVQVMNRFEERNACLRGYDKSTPSVSRPGWTVRTIQEGDEEKLRRYERIATIVTQEAAGAGDAREAEARRILRAFLLSAHEGDDLQMNVHGVHFRGEANATFLRIAGVDISITEFVGMLGELRNRDIKSLTLLACNISEADAEKMSAALGGATVFYTGAGQAVNAAAMGVPVVGDFNERVGADRIIPGEKVIERTYKVGELTYNPGDYAWRDAGEKHRFRRYPE